MTADKPTPQDAQEARMRALDRAAIDRMRFSQRRTRHASAMSEDGYRQALRETRSRRLGAP
ncbi:hypothetical protein [Rhizobacter sp. Root1221]|uniref:hypothetical protein n=1 Tax=Rhizobacter sp. Root1221 TaxID=1736433 RepID=UPI0006F56CA8|nr:hypothetical protein [Rhizobacter sp. Root1221]KQW02197.1 hypothetical protein ASC87_13275 [Rhizobacter sp. Root1221]